MSPAILHLEDSELDADLICNRLRKGGYAEGLERVVCRDAYLARLNAPQGIDLILSDYHIPGFDGLEALEAAQAARPGVPFVFVSGAIGEDTAVEMLKRGATDYVLKGRLERLPSAIERALAEARGRTDRLRAEAEVRRLNDELEATVAERTKELLATNEQLQGFTYSVAHDLRQQIRGISTNAALLLDDAPEGMNEEQRDQLNRLVRASRQLGALVDDLLRYARLGRQTVVAERVDLSVLASNVAERLATEEYTGRPIAVEIEPGMVVRGDSAMLGLVLQNLLDNAFKYASYEANPLVSIGWNDDGFFVRDNGIGFDMAFVHKIFEPFERLHSGNLFAGTGIGLANVKRIVEKHGGRIWAEGVPGKGATFFFTLGENPIA